MRSLHRHKGVRTLTSEETSLLPPDVNIHIDQGLDGAARQGTAIAFPQREGVVSARFLTTPAPVS